MSLFFWRIAVHWFLGGANRRFWFRRGSLLRSFDLFFCFAAFFNGHFTHFKTQAAADILWERAFGQGVGDGVEAHVGIGGIHVAFKI